MKTTFAMKSFIKKLIGGMVSTMVGLAMVLPLITSAQIVPTLWSKISGDLFTNPQFLNIHVAGCFIGAGYGTPCGSIGGGITSINGDVTPAQLISAGPGISIATVAGNTTITNTASGTITGGGVANQVTYWNGATSITGDGFFTYDPLINHLNVGSNAGALLDVNPSSQQITLNSGTNGLIINDLGGNTAVDVNTVSKIVQLGDVDSAANDTVLTVNDSTLISTLSGAWGPVFRTDTDTNTRSVFLGDTVGTLNGTNSLTHPGNAAVTGSAISGGEQATYQLRANGISGRIASIGYAVGATSRRFEVTDTTIGWKGATDTIFLPDADGALGEALVTDGSGNLSFAAVGTGTIGGTIAATQVGYGSGINTLTSDATFTRTPSNFTVQALNGGNTAELQVDANTPTINTFASDGTNTTTLSMDATQKSVLNFGNGVTDSNVDLDLTGASLGWNSGTGNSSGISAALSTLSLTNNDGAGNSTTWLWPTADSQPGDVLTTDGNGTLSFAAGGSVDTSNAISVSVATTTVLPGAPTYNNGVLGVGATLTRTGNGALGNIDGQPTIVADRILVKNQVATLQNGVYEVTDVGSAGTPYILTRTTDSDLDTEFDDQVVVPTTGTTQANQIFGQTTETPIIGTNPIVYITVTNTYVTQSVTGTQTNGNVPFWTNNPRQLNRGNSRLAVPGNTWLNSMLRLGGGTQGGRMVFRSGTNVDNVFIGYNDATTANAFNINNISAGGELRNTIAGTTSFWTLYSNSGLRVLLGDQGQLMAPYDVAAGSTYRLGFRELAANGTNFVGFKAPDLIGSSLTWTLPNADSTGTQALTSNGSGILGWTTVGSGTVTGSGTSPRIPYWSSASALTDDASFTRLAGRGITLQDDSTFKNVFIGTTTGVVGATGSANVALGINTLNALTNGTQNTAIGEDASGSITSGGHNVAIGNMAGFENVSNSNSVYIGREAGRRMQADENIAFGYGAMFGSGTPANNTGQRNIALGRSSLEGLTSGQNNIAIGYATGTSIANGADNIFMGQSTGTALTGGTSYNVMLGYNVGLSRTGGNSNVFIGEGVNNGAIGTGATNVGIGKTSLQFLTSGAENVAIGGSTAGTLTTGSQNVVIGQSANVAASGTTGAIALGYQASAATNEFALPDAITKWKFQGDSYTLPTAFPASNGDALTSTTAGVMSWTSVGSGLTGSGTAPRIPYWSTATNLTDDAFFTRIAGQGIGLEDNATNHSLFLGFSAGNNTSSGLDNIAMSLNAGDSLTSGSQNLFIGRSAGTATSTSSDNVFLGYFAGSANISGASNVYIGSEAGRLNTAGSNVIIGKEAGETLAYANATMVGFQAGQNASGSSGVFLGYQAGQNATGNNSIYIGQQSAATITSGLFNLFIGLQSDGSTSSISNSIVIGQSNVATANQQLVVGNKTTVGASAITQAFFGEGVTDGSPTTMVFNATGGSGTDIAAAPFVIAAGRSTGVATPASVRIQTGLVGTTGTTAQTLADIHEWTSLQSWAKKGQRSNRTAVADTNYTILLSDYVISYTSLSAARTVTVPDASTVAAGTTYIIKDAVCDSATDNIILDPAGTDTIDTATTFTMNVNCMSITIMSDGGTNWEIL